MNFLLAAILTLSPSAHSATGRSGPVGLKLELFKTKLRIGEHIFAKTTLKNYSKKPMLVTDWIYRGSDNLGEEWSNRCRSSYGSTLEIQDSRGHRVEPRFYDVGVRYRDNPFEQTVGQIDTETLKNLEKWDSKGLSKKALEERYRNEIVAADARKLSARYPAVKLKAGESISSLPWCAEHTPHLAVVCPSGFVELPFFILDQPGLYRIRAVYDHSPTEETKEWAADWNVRAESDWTTFEVTR